MERIPHYLNRGIEALAWLLTFLRAVAELMDCEERGPEDRSPLPPPF